MLESPGFPAIVQGDQAAPPERWLAVYREASFAPQPRTSLGGGTVHTFLQGMLFLPRGNAGRDADIQALKGLALSLAGGFVLSLGNVLLDAAKDAVVEKALLPEKAVEEQLKARLRSPNLFVVPWGDVVEAADAVTRENRRLIRSYVRRTTVRAVDAAGTERAFTFTNRVAKNDRLEIPQSFPFKLFERRAAVEREAVEWLVLTTAVGYHARAKEKLAALGIEIAGPYVNETALREALDAGLETGRVAEVKYADVVDALDVAWVLGAFDVWREQHGDAELARRRLELLVPVLPAYRHEPHLAQLVELDEHLAAGGTEDSVTGSVRVAEHATNLA